MTNTTFVLRLSTDNVQANNSNLHNHEDSLSTQYNKCINYIQNNNINTGHTDSINHINNNGTKFTIDHKLDKIILTYHSPAYNVNSYYLNHFLGILKFLKNHQIIFSKVNRFSRNVKNAIEMLDICARNNITLIFVEENLIFSSTTVNRAPLISAIAVAESESIQKSENSKESRKRKKENNSHFNTAGFGNSFKREWEIYILLLIERLNSISTDNPLKLEYIQKYMYKIIKKYPISHDEKNIKIRFIEENIIEIKDGITYAHVLNDPQDLSEISDLLMDFGIGSFENNNEKIILFKDNYDNELDKMNKIPSMTYKTTVTDETPLSICNANNLDISQFLIEINKHFDINIRENTKFKKNTEMVLYKETNIPVKNTNQKPSFYDLDKIYSNFLSKMNEHDTIYVKNVEEIQLELQNLCENDEIDEVIDDFQQSSIDENPSKSKKARTDLTKLSDEELGVLLKKFLEKN